MKLKEKLAEEDFWNTHPNGALTIEREAWPKAYLRGFEKAREMSLHSCQIASDIDDVFTRIQELGEQEA